jgi:hypothetical protein
MGEETMKDKVKEAVQHSFKQLLNEDGSLFNCPIEEGYPSYARKLHEVCINHKLANHLEDAILPFIANNGKMYVDIEFNREGQNYKEVLMNGANKILRPDIIIHNRKSDRDKSNFLVVECKKDGSSQAEIEEDKRKICAMMDDGCYQYLFGLRVSYGRDNIEADLFYRNNGGIDSERIFITADHFDEVL